MPRPLCGPLSTFDLVEAFQLSQALWTLHDLGVLVSLQRPATARSLARKHRVDAVFLRGILEYAVARTDVLQKVGRCFVCTRSYSPAARFLLELYGGAYRNNAWELAALMRAPPRAAGAVDTTRHARAFAGVQASGHEWLANIIQKLALNHVLDIGCGPAALLVDLAAADRKFRGWGLDVNPAMIRAAMGRIRAAGVAARVRVMQGTLPDLYRALPKAVFSAIRTVTACQVAKQPFGRGVHRPVSWLREMRR